MENLEQSNNKNVSLSLIAEYGTSDSESDDTEAHSIENMLNDDSEESMELSQMVLKNNIINACAHGPLSGNIREDLETTRHMIIDSAESGVAEYEVTEYRDAESESESSTSSDSSDSEVDSVKDVEELSSSDENEASNTASKVEPPKVQGEMGLDDLPPIEDLAISLPAEQTTKIGTIASIVDRLVIVRALPETPAVDLDSILFVDNGAKALGKVFDVFGPVTEPHYCVRFNSQDHVKERGVQPGMDVFIAPDTQHTKYVFLTQLMKIKGSDASWLNDVEPPPTHIEYSDDEDERNAKRQHKLSKQGDAAAAVVEEPKRAPPQQRSQRPADGSSRFGSGPSRGRNPFAARRNNPNNVPRFGRPWPDMRTPPPHGDFNFPPFSAPPMFPPVFPPPPFNPNTPPPFAGNQQPFGGNQQPLGVNQQPLRGNQQPIRGNRPPLFGGNRFPFGGNQSQFGGNQRMHQTPNQMLNSIRFRQQSPVFGSTFCTMPGPQPRWVNNGTPPPPGT